jgi:hypothetical protein
MSNLRQLTLGALAFIIFSSLAVPALGATISGCSDDGRKCIIKLETGSIGDSVRVFDLKAFWVGSGKITARRGSYGEITLGKTKGAILKGYTVFVSNESSDASIQWTAASGK